MFLNIQIGSHEHKTDYLDEWQEAYIVNWVRNYSCAPHILIGGVHSEQSAVHFSILNNFEKKNPLWILHHGNFHNYSKNTIWNNGDDVDEKEVKT